MMTSSLYNNDDVIMSRLQVLKQESELHKTTT